MPPDHVPYLRGSENLSYENPLLPLNENDITKISPHLGRSQYVTWEVRMSLSRYSPAK